MTAILLAWGASAAVLLLLAAYLGTLVKLRPGLLGVLVDSRGRMSLNKLQLAVWSLVIISLVFGVFLGRLIDGVPDALGFTVPDEVLGLLGISFGSGVTTGVIKATKNAKDVGVGQLATFTKTQTPPFFGQVFLLEEGEFADQVIDVTKFQNFSFTILLVVAYIALAIQAITNADSAAGVTALPTISGTFLVLLGISYAGYVGGKLPTQAGTPGGPPPGGDNEQAAPGPDAAPSAADAAGANSPSATAPGATKK